MNSKIELDRLFGRVVKAVHSKCTGASPRKFKSCSSRFLFCLFSPSPIISRIQSLFFSGIHFYRFFILEMSFDKKVKKSKQLNSKFYHHKERSQSESPNTIGGRIFALGEPLQPDGHIISSADIYSWKLKKEYDGTVYAVYCIHVSLKSGFKWIVERRYTQFRELRKEINKVRPELHSLTFPKKNWLFNLSKPALKNRQDLLNQYLSEIIAITPQILEIGKQVLRISQDLSPYTLFCVCIAIFLEVEIRLSSEINNSNKSQPMRRSLSFGSLSQALSIKDFHLIKVLGKGSFGKVYLVRPIRAPQSEVYAMKVLRKAEVVKRHQVEHTLTERYILATVRHPFILCLRHAFQTGDKLYMVTDYCPGGELFFHLKRLRRFTEGKTERI